MCKNGMIHSPNLCLEHMLNTSCDETAVCNTGSLDISKHLREDGSLDRDKLRDTVQIAARALDAMIDANYFPTEASEKFARKYRAIGLGVMGFQNALYHKDMPFSSPDALKFSNECFELIAYHTIAESIELSRRFGACPIFGATEWASGVLPMDFLPAGVNATLDWEFLRGGLKKFGIRNAYLNANSPTRKISRLMGCYPGLAPATRNVFVKQLSNNHEMMIISQELVNTLKRHGFWNKEIHKQIRYFEGELAVIDEISEEIKNLYCTAFMIDSPILIEHASVCQRWIDQSQSVRLFLATPNLHALSTMFIDAWRKGIKAINEVKSAGFTLDKEFGEAGTFSSGTSAMLNALDRLHGGISTVWAH
jgi:ribonucleoside-diphosphate reductase alpha chain